MAINDSHFPVTVGQTTVGGHHLCLSGFPVEYTDFCEH